jgi:hypothetical protein
VVRGCIDGAGVVGADTLWYRQPATQWVEALPIGNGRLGGMVFGGAAAEHIQLNEDTVWTGESRDRLNPEAAAALPEVRRLLFAGKPAEAEKLVNEKMMAIPLRMPPYQPLGDLHVKFAGHESPAEYRRQLDLDTGVASVSYRIGKVRYTREVFASAPAGVIVLRIVGSEAGQVSFTATLDREADATSRAVAPDRLQLTGEAIVHDDKQYPTERKVGVKFAAVLRAVAQGGQ